MVTPKNRLAGGEAPLLCRQHGIPQGPARADARRSTGRDTRALSVPLLTTVGSPPGIQAIRDQLLPLSFPAHVRTWYNAQDPRDVVAALREIFARSKIRSGIERICGWGTWIRTKIDGGRIPRLVT